jgi:hypothetical protein
MLAVDKAASLAADNGAHLLIVTAYEPASEQDVKSASDALKHDWHPHSDVRPADVRPSAGESRSWSRPRSVTQGSSTAITACRGAQLGQRLGQSGMDGEQR